MKSLKTKIYESELNEGFYKNIGGMVRPTTKDELINEIKIRVNRDQYNFNDIDTSKITDMSFLFSGSDLRYKMLDKDFDVSGWDVSNVVDMHNMFYGCKNFNSDLSKWDVSMVRDMTSMFKKSGMKVLPNWYK